VESLCQISKSGMFRLSICRLPIYVSFFRIFLFLRVDLEGRSDDKIRIMEAVHELQTKRADKQVILNGTDCR
jgi:hypothetical protein